MKAIILAAGESKRLRPLTDNLPKCLLKIGEKSILDYQLDNLKRAGIIEAVVVTGFEAQKLENHLRENHPDFSFTFIENKDYQKTYPAHGLWMAKNFLIEEVLYLNADVICHPDIIKKVVDDNRESLTAIQRNPWDEEEVNVILKKDSEEITEIGKHISKELSYGEFIGVTKIGKDFCDELVKVLDLFIEKEEYKKFAADAINLAIQRGQKMEILDVSDLPAIEIDTIEDYENAKKKVEKIKNLTNA